MSKKKVKRVVLGSALVYGLRGNYQQMVYWLAAFTITYSVTWMGK